ncbi:hypothetical protein KQX54_018116 [Cotesia glomerata]|uniref:Uncharacterized protein n=1 Tax=Cotesia glomerata TaxID=32391 RepID=A0AAV7IEY6_COTGL|nr:hypothetical protein KQX54_018116 [Cotesia glomerata]
MIKKIFKTKKEKGEGKNRVEWRKRFWLAAYIVPYEICMYKNKIKAQQYENRAQAKQTSYAYKSTSADENRRTNLYAMSAVGTSASFDVLGVPLLRVKLYLTSVYISLYTLHFAVKHQNKVSLLVRAILMLISGPKFSHQAYTCTW